MGGGKGKNPHLQCRVSFLLKAASYLTNPDQPKVDLASHADILKETAFPKQKDDTEEKEICTANQGSVRNEKQEANEQSNPTNPSKSSNLSRQLVSSLLAISQKAQIHLSSSAKHSICKKCHSVLILGSTATSQMDNKSRGGKKPWAAVLVKTCKHCGTVKRFPVGAKRQKPRKERKQQALHD
ncbi:MAG: hypothetical protein MMC33_006538 [Icmadophila ericetorum]|nr:hypothetical protein [Icmadophila ericetorum]